MNEVFISYAREDQSEAIKLRNALRAEQIEIWWDDDLLASTKFEETIDVSLRKAATIIVLWSEHSMSSSWVNYEASIGKVRDVLVPIKISDCDVPDLFSGIHTADFIGWDGLGHREFDKLINVVRLKIEEAQEREKATAKQKQVEKERQDIIDELPKKLKSSRTWTTLAAIVALSGLAFGLYNYIRLSADLSRYALKSDIPAEKELPDLSVYALKSDVPDVPDLSGYALKSDLATVQHRVGTNTDFKSIDQQVKGSSGIEGLPIKFGDSIDRVQEALQTKTKPSLYTSGSRGEWSLRLRTKGVWTFFSTDKLLKTIRLDAPYKGKIGGIAVGDTLETLFDKLGESLVKPNTIGSTTSYSYYPNDSLTVRFEINRSSKVETIFLFK